MKNRHKREDKVPMLTDGFGMDFHVTATNDVGRMQVTITDHWGAFIPVPFKLWDHLVNDTYHPMIMDRYRMLHPQVAYEEAIIHYCRKHQDMYICLN